MSIIFVLIPIAVLFVLIGLGVFFWAVRSRQFDDLDKEAYSILFDNQTKPAPAADPAPASVGLPADGDTNTASDADANGSINATSSKNH
jgi:cbb3-type cytochrome oxidase maturation protein